jgi:hypothetical protein
MLVEGFSQPMPTLSETLGKIKDRVSSAIYSVAVSLTSLLQNRNTLNSTGDLVCLFALTHVLGILPSLTI